MAKRGNDAAFRRLDTVAILRSLTEDDASDSTQHPGTPRRTKAKTDSSFNAGSNRKSRQPDPNMDTRTARKPSRAIRDPKKDAPFFEVVATSFSLLHDMRPMQANHTPTKAPG